MPTLQERYDFIVTHVKKAYDDLSNLRLTEGYKHIAIIIAELKNWERK